MAGQRRNGGKAEGAGAREGAGATPDFVHLHVHTHYSLLDGAARIPALIEKCKQFGMPAVAMTDHGNMFGAIEFYQAAVKAGVKPIIGCETYIAPFDRKDKSVPAGGFDSAYHLLLLAMDLTGYRNLLKLASIGYLEGFYRKPRIDKTVLREFNQGLICTSTCLGGEIPQGLLRRNMAEARRLAETYLDIFGPDRFFVELQNQGIDKVENGIEINQVAINAELSDLAKKLGVGAIATNDVHYLEHDDVEAHDVLCCINTRAQVADKERFRFDADQFYFKSRQEMAAALPDYPQALANTLRVAEMCNLEIDFGRRYAPVYRTPKGKTADEYLRELVYAGAVERYQRHEATEPRDKSHEATKPRSHEGERAGNREQGTETFGDVGPRDTSSPSSLRGSVASWLPQELRERIDYELSVVKEKGFSGYFLIVWDVVRWCGEQGIPCQARGSGCSTVVGYCLRISHVDPIHYGLYFERFMDPERDEMPDIDLDICQDGRQRVIEYVRGKYGHVAQIITFGTLKSRAAIRDVCRAMGISLADADRVAKLVPEELKMTLEKALAAEPQLKQLYDAEPQWKKVIDICRRIEGLARHASVHAAGVVIADVALDTLVPLYKPADSTDIITQFDGPTVEKIGLLKMDFLGLRTLSQIDLACRMVRELHGIEIDRENLDLADPRVYELLARGDTKGIFQFESGGMRDVLMKMKPNRIEDLIAANALFRPGPMAYINEYVARKHGRTQWETPHPLMTEVLAETYGIMVYQEQVSRLVNRLGGVPLRRAFRLAKAISKKKTEMINAEREPFLEGCEKQGVKRKVGEQIFEDILKFGGYAFNKAHSSGYALLAFQTAYLKTYYPVEFMAALMTYESGNSTKLAEYLNECRSIRQRDESVGIAINPPDVNASAMGFTVVYDESREQEEEIERSRDREIETAKGRILFGLSAISGLGAKAVQAILDARREGGRLRDIYDFCERVDLTAVNRAAIEALIKAGAFDSTGAMRRALMDIAGSAIEHGQGVQRDKRSGQMSMFGDLGGSAPPPPIPASEWSEAELLLHEKQTLGFYVTKHPLAQHEALIRQFGTATTTDIKAIAARIGREAPPAGGDRGRRGSGPNVVVGGMISSVRNVPIRNGRSAGKKMAIMLFEDLVGSIEAIVFPDSLEEMQPLLRPDTVVFITAEIDTRREEPCLRVNRITPLERVRPELAESVVVQLHSLGGPLEQMERMRTLCQSHRGRCPVLFRIQSAEGWTATVEGGDAARVNPTEEFMAGMSALAGADRVHCLGSSR